MYVWAALFAGSVAWLSIVRTSLYILIIVTGAMILALALVLVSMPRLRPWVRAAPGNAAATQRAATGEGVSRQARSRPAPVPAPPVPAPSAAATGRPASAMFTAMAENQAAPLPADPEATGPVPAPPRPGRVARQSFEPPAEPAPWPGFAQAEPSGSAPQSELTPPADGLAAEPRSWFEPAQPAAPGHQNGSTPASRTGADLL
jgi:hypothetical protein